MKTLAGVMCAIGLSVVVLAIAGGLMSKSGGSTTASASTVISIPAANPAQAAKCREVLKSAPRGAVRSYKADGEYGTVVVGPQFDFADFETKQLLDANMRCILSDGRDGYAGLKYVEYMDWRTNKEVAKWSSVTGFSVD